MKFIVHHGIENKYYPVVYGCEETEKKDWYITEDGRIVRHEDWDRFKFNTEREADQFIKNWLPKTQWITEKEVSEAANKGGKEALLASITHWKQIVLAGYKGYKLANTELKVGAGCNYCALCQRYYQKSEKCPLKNDVCNGEGCVNEWRNARVDLECDYSVKSAVILLNKLISIYNETYGKETETFNSGDIVEFNNDGEIYKRLIISIERKLYAVDKDGRFRGYEKDFQICGYKKIGRCIDFVVDKNSKY